ISVVDLVDGGQTWDEVLELASALEEAGVSALNTGVGWHEARIPTIITQVPRGAWAEYTARLKQAVSIPVCASNRINTPELADELIRTGRADLVSMARPLLADPDFVLKASAGRSDEINTCIACNQACLDHGFSGQLASCLVNPRACQETTLLLGPTRSRKKVAVVGAGPAGLSTAITAAERGHAVSLFEASEAIGGQFRLAMQVPGKEDFRDTMRYFARRVEVLGVDLHLNTAATAETLSGYDEIVIATGVEPRLPEIDGIDHPYVMTYADVLAGRQVPGRRVAVIGAGGIGVDVCHWLVADPHEDLAHWMSRWGVDQTWSKRGGITERAAHAGLREVTLLQRKPTPIGIGLGKTSGWAHREVLKQAGVRLVSGAAYDRIDDLGLHYTAGGEAMTLAVDSIVVCAGQLSVRKLMDELQSIDRAAHLIGGAELAGELDAKRAIAQGVTLASQL